MSIYGYARVSSREQNLQRQYNALNGMEVKPERIFADKQSGKNYDRPEYQKMLSILQPGDTLYITSLDRLGRNYLETEEQFRILTRVKQVCVVILDLPLSNLKMPDDITSVLLNDITIRLMNYISDMEHKNIRKRQAEGIAAARLSGKRLGRKEIELPENYEEIIARWRRKEITMEEATEICKCSRSTLYRRWKRMEGQE